MENKIDLLLEISLASHGDHDSLLSIVEQLAPLRPREVKSVFLASPIRKAWGLLKKAFEEYIEDQSRSPLSSRSNQEVIEKVKRVYSIFDSVYDELRDKGSARIEKFVSTVPEPETETDPTDPTGPEEEEIDAEDDEPTVEIPANQRKKTQEFMEKTVHLLALYLIKNEKLTPPSNYGRLMRNYFIKKRELRKGTLGENLILAEEERNTEPQDDINQLQDLLTQEIDITPEEAEKSYDSVLKSLGLSPTDPAQELKNSMEDKVNEPRFEDNLKVIKFLIFKGAGIDQSEANDLAEKDPFSSATLEEGGLQPRILDLQKFKDQRLEEGMLGMFGAWVEYALKGMFGGWGSNLQVIGSKQDVEYFAKALSGEAKYIQAAKRHGLDHPTTYKNKSSLDVAVKNFEKETGIKWPFK